jgi:hypothetical protein
VRNQFFERPIPGAGNDPIFKLDRFRPLPPVPRGWRTTVCDNHTANKGPYFPCQGPMILTQRPFNFQAGYVCDRGLVCSDCNIRNKRNYDMIMEAARLGVCKTCRNRERDPRTNANNSNGTGVPTPSYDCTCPDYPLDGIRNGGAMCSACVDAVAVYVEGMTNAAIHERCLITFSDRRRRASKRARQKHYGIYDIHPYPPRGPPHAEPRCICGRKARHDRVTWPTNVDIDPVRSCALCSRIPLGMSVETDANNKIIGPGVRLADPFGILPNGKRNGARGWVRS